MVIISNSNKKIELKIGVKTILGIKQPFKYVIETIGGSIFEGTVITNAPLAITPSTDIKEIRIIFDEDSVVPLHLIR